MREDPTVDGRRQRGCGSYPASVDRTPVRPGTGVGSILVDRALTHTRSGIEGLPGSIGDRTTDKMTGEALMRYSFTNELATSASAWSLWRVWTDADRRAQRTPPQLRASSQVRADRTSRGRVLPMGYARRARSRDLSFAAVPPAAGATCSGCVQQSSRLVGVAVTGPSRCVGGFVVTVSLWWVISLLGGWCRGRVLAAVTRTPTG